MSTTLNLSVQMTLARTVTDDEAREIAGKLQAELDGNRDDYGPGAGVVERAVVAVERAPDEDDERNALLNSFGESAFRDGQIRDHLARLG